MHSLIFALCRGETALMDSLKGLMILFVILGHSMLKIYENPFLLLPFFRFISPCVFVFVYLFGLSQGRTRKRPGKNLSKIASFFLLYLFWSSISFVLYITLDGKFADPWVTRTVFGLSDSNVSNYILTILTFTGSWQYYFVFVIIILLFISIFIRKASSVFNVILLGAVGNGLFISYWAVFQERLLPPVLGAFLTYLNPLHWMFPFILGYKDAQEGKIRDDVNLKTIIVFSILLIAGSFEYWYAYRKFHTLVGTDQFSVFTILLGVYGLPVFIRISRYLNLRIIKKMGRYSFLLFITHMPLQWFVYVFLDGYLNLPKWLWVILMVVSSIIFVDVLTKVARYLPGYLRKTVIGF